MKDFFIKLIIIMFSIVIGILGFAALPWITIFVGLQMLPPPPKPEIKYGEFSFRLEYEINGQQKVINDTLICEYDGIGINEGQGKYLKWKMRLASGNERITLLKVDDSKEIYYTPGSAGYYMGAYYPNRTDASIIEMDGKKTHSRSIHSDELLNKYNIKLINWDCTQPIVNNFPKKFTVFHLFNFILDFISKYLMVIMLVILLIVYLFYRFTH